MLDIPYIPGEWNSLLEKTFEKKTAKGQTLDGMSVIGKYISKMYMSQWKDYRWSDSDRLIAEAEETKKRLAEEQRSVDEALREQYEKGEISESEYKTLSSQEEVQNAFYAEASAKGIGANAPGQLGDVVGEDNAYREDDFMDQSELENEAVKELTDDDKLYLALKWGRLYKPFEWLELEKKYKEMSNSFDIQDSDTEGSLILICKTYLKMNQALDQGDFDGFQKLGRNYDTLRKSSKFTAAQNKEKTNDFVDSVGEIVAYCERMGGAIPKYEITYDYDIIDTEIRDMKDYNRSLIYEDTALAQQVEAYIKKREIAEARKQDQEEAKEKGLTEVTLENEDYTAELERRYEEQLQDEEIYVPENEGVDVN